MPKNPNDYRRAQNRVEAFASTLGFQCYDHLVAVEDMVVDYLMTPCPFCGSGMLGFGRDLEREKNTKVMAFHTATACEVYLGCNTPIEFKKAFALFRLMGWPNGCPQVSRSKSAGGTPS